jgi:hypothetical protein
MICLAFIQFSRTTSLTVTFALSVTVIGKTQTLSWSKFFAFPPSRTGYLNDFPRLYCGHRFHPKCIFTHWDSYTIFSNPCCNCRLSQGWLKDRMDFPAQKQDKCYSWDGGTMAKDDSNLDWGIQRCLQENWPGGIQALDENPLDPKHQERWWRIQIVAERTARAALREAGGWNKLD